MRKLLSSIIILFLSFNVLAFSNSDIIDQFRSFGSVTDTYDYISCSSESSVKGPLSEDTFQSFCEVVKNSDACKDVEEDEKITCESIDENEIDITSFSFIYNCFRGLWRSLVNLFEFVVEMIKGSLGYVFDSELRQEKNEALGEYYDSFKNYLAIEFDKAYEETGDDVDASLLVAKDIMKMGMDAISDMIKDTYYTLGCYNQKARQARVCEIVGEVIMPPAAAVTLIFKGPKMVKRLKEVVSEHTKKPQSSIVSDEDLAKKKTARAISPEEAQNSNTRAVSAKLEEIIKEEKHDFLSAPQIGQGIQLVVIRSKENKIRKFANPVIKSDNGNELSISYLDIDTGKIINESINNVDRKRTIAAIDRLNGRRFNFQDDSYYNSLGIKGTQELNESQKNQLGQMINGLNKDEQQKFKAYAQRLGEDISDIRNPRSLVSSLNDGDAYSDVLSLYSNIVKSSSSAQKFKKFDQWVKSDAHALYLYDFLLKDGIEKNSDSLRYLMARNEYFKNVRPIRGPPGTLVTFSFEKESKVDDITLWYKTSNYTDEEWLNLSGEQRLSLVRKATMISRKKVSEDKITGTEFKPHYLGGFSQEVGDYLIDKSPIWEIANKKYEISLERTLDEISEVSELTGETHSFHAHVVFDLPENYDKFDRFQLWSKHTNDYLYLKGMEEGLHGNELTGIAHFAEDAPAKAKRSMNNALPETLSSIGVRSHKFFSMGIRGDLYGKSPVSKHKKVGLELRDTTRKLDILSDHMKKVTATVQDFKWESLPTEVTRKNMPALRVNQDLIGRDLAGKVSDSFLDTLKNDVITASIALNRFEEGRYFDYQRGTFRELTSEDKKQIVEARQYFIDEMGKIDRELIEMKRKGESFEKEDVEMAVQMTLSEWAKMARVSRFYDGI
ncbi:hypothetical protein [Halobacteriovorax sp. YZS-1-1]|uniref:hypothetical protein n=1 Tax=unclassified Halobacteriovorax TaxID=2639665 RepID=UPI0039995E09